LAPLIRIVWPLTNPWFGMVTVAVERLSVMLVTGKAGPSLGIQAGLAGCSAVARSSGSVKPTCTPVGLQPVTETTPAGTMLRAVESALA